MRSEPSIYSGLSISLLFHGAVVSVFIVKSILLPSEPQIYQRTIRVDMVALPDKLDQGPKLTPIIETKPADKTPAPEPLKAAPEKSKEIPIAPIDPKKALSAIEKLKQKKQAEDLKRQKAQEKIERQNAQELAEIAKQFEIKKQEFKGSVISAGSSLSGLESVQMNDYIAAIDDHVKRLWELPEYLANNKSLKTRIRIRINQDGSLKSFEVVVRSTDQSYDTIVMDTVKSADPFPAPPEKFVDIVGIDGVLLGFPE